MPIEAANAPASNGPTAATPAAAAGQRAARPLQGRRILLAEDGRDNQRLITMLLQRAGATVVVAENGSRAVAALCEDGDPAHPLQQPSPFDLVLLDMQMPLMDGYAAAALLREKGCDRPLIALTAHALEGDRERCLAAGCDDYIRKPVDQALLVSACERAAHARGSS